MKNVRLVLLLVIVMMSVVCFNVNASSIVSPINAWASGELYGTATGALKVLDSSRLNSSNQLIVGDWSNNWIWNTNTFTSYQWIVIDLGQNYDIDEIRIWNYFDSADPDASGRGIKEFNLWFGTDSGSTILPVAGVVGNPLSEANGWRYMIGGGTLAKAPVATEPISPTNVLTSGINYSADNSLGVRYIGIDVGLSTWDGSQGFTLGGLAQVQVTVIPEPATLVMLCLGCVALKRRIK